MEFAHRMAGLSNHKRVLALSVTMALGLSLASWAGVTMDAHWGFDGFSRPGRWAPLAVMIENLPAAGTPGAARGKDVVGRLVASSRSADGREAAAETQVNVPWQTRKRYLLYLKASDDPHGEVVARLFDQRGKAISTISLKNKPVIEPERLVVVLTSDPSAGAVIPRIERPVATQMLSPDLAPDRWFGYDSADVVVVPRYSSNMLDPGRLDALEQWVSAGGHLVVLGGRDALSLRASPIESWLPARVRGLIEANSDLFDLSPAAPPAARRQIVLADLELAPQGHAVWRGDGRLLAARRWVGLGFVDLWAFDLSAQDNSVCDLWSSLFGPAGAADRGRDFLDTFTSGFDFGLDTRKPSLWLVGFALLAYFLVVGPVNFHFLAKKRKQEWGWVTVPAIVAVFSVAIYTLAYRSKGGESVRRSFTLFQTRAGQRQGRAVSIGGFFASASGRYAIEFQGLSGAATDKTEKTDGTNGRNGPNGPDGPDGLNGHAEAGPTLFPLALWSEPDESVGGLLRPRTGQRLSALSRIGPPAGPKTQGAATIPPVEESGGAMRYTARSIRQWSLEYFEGEGLADLDGPIDATLRRDLNGVTGRVINNTNLYLEDASLVVGDAVCALGALAPGASAEVNLPLASQAPKSGASKEPGPSAQSAVSGVHGEAATSAAIALSGGWNPQASGRFQGVGAAKAFALERRVRAMFARAVLNRWPIGPVPRGGERPLLVAWPRQNPLSLKSSPRATQSSDHVMLVCECEARVAGGGARFGGPSDSGAIHGAEPVLAAQGADGVEFYADKAARVWTDAPGPAVALLNGSVVYAFVPPVANEDAAPAAASLYVRCVDSPARKHVFEVSVFNFATRRFETPVAGASGWIRLNPRAHLNPFDRRVVVRAASVTSPETPMTIKLGASDACALTALDAAFWFAPATAPIRQ